MSALKSTISTRSESFRANFTTNRAIADDLRRKVEDVAQGGGETAREKHLARGKMLPRERIRRLIDIGSPFLELSQLAAFGMYDSEVPSAGILTGIGCPGWNA
jgi:3-methylcrotonyl-CoA carboxylase beta subunit